MRLSKEYRVGMDGISQFEDAACHASTLASADFMRFRSGHGQLRRFGQGSGPPIVLIPGLAGGWQLLATLGRRLALQSEVILWDLPDEGAVFLGNRQALKVGDYARLLCEALGEKGIERPVLLGVSYGGAIALEFATRYPRGLSALVLSGADSHFPGNIGSRVARHVLERFPIPSDCRFINQFFNLFHGGKPESESLARYLVERCWQTDQSIMLSRLRSLDTYDVREQLWRIDVPTLVVAGARDVVVSPARQRRLADNLADSRFREIPGAGHIGFLSHPDTLRKEVFQFLQACQPAAL